MRRILLEASTLGVVSAACATFYVRHLFILYPPTPVSGRDTIHAILPFPRSTRPETNPYTIEGFVRHFFDSPFTRLEGLAARLTGYEHVPGEDYAHGLFRVISRPSSDAQQRSPLGPPKLSYRSECSVSLHSDNESENQGSGGDNTLVVRWIMPSPILSFGHRVGIRIPPSGIQSFRFDNMKDEDGTEAVEVSYTCIEDWHGASKAGKAEWWHRLYMRVLFDSARRRMLRYPQ